MFTLLYCADQAKYIAGETMIMDNVEQEILVQVQWLSYSVRDLLILKTTTDQILCRLIVDQNIQPMLMILVDYLPVEEDKTDN